MRGLGLADYEQVGLALLAGAVAIVGGVGYAVYRATGGKKGGKKKRTRNLMIGTTAGVGALAAVVVYGRHRQAVVDAARAQPYSFDADPRVQPKI